MVSQLAEDAKVSFGSVVDELAARNPKLAIEAKMANLLENFQAPSGVSFSGALPQVAHVAALENNDMKRPALEAAKTF